MIHLKKTSFHVISHLNHKQQGPFYLLTYLLGTNREWTSDAAGGVPIKKNPVGVAHIQELVSCDTGASDILQDHN